MKLSDNFSVLCLCFLFIFGSAAYTGIFILEHGLAKAWLAVQEREFNITIMLFFLCSGFLGLLFLTIPRLLRDRNRDAFREKYAERYK